MGVGTGLGASIGLAAESTYGTYVAPTRFFAGRSFNLKKAFGLQPVSGVMAGRPMAPDEVVTTEAGTGHLEADVMRSQWGLILQHLFGGSVAPVQQGGSAAYLQSHVWTDNIGKFLSVQKGVPDTGGTARPYTGLGSKITQAEFSCGVGENLQAAVDFDIRQISEAQSLAAPSVPAGNLPFNFSQMGVKLGAYGSEATVQGVKRVAVSIARPQDVERQYAGNAGLKVEPLWNDFAAITGTLDIDYVTKADFVDRFVGHTSTALVWEFIGPIIASTFAYTFRIRCPKVYFGADIPEVSGPDTNRASVPFAAFYDTTNGLVSCDYMSTDTSV